MSAILRTARVLVTLVAVPWDAFVGAFLFYTMLTLVVLGGADLASPVIAGVYLAVPVAYGLLIIGRLGRAIAHATLPAGGDTSLVLH